MQDQRPLSRITEAVLLGRQIKDLEDERAVIVQDSEEKKELLKSVDRQLDLLWLEVGKLKHASGE